MTNLFKKSICLVLLALPLLAQASAIEQFKSFTANTKSAKGDFVQQQYKVVNGVTKISKSASGTFVFARPGKFVWSYLKPYEQVLQADGEQFYINDKDLNQVTIKKLGNALGSSPASILFGSSDLEKNFTLKESGVKQGIEWLEATPKEQDSSFQQIGIGMKDGVPVALELHDNFGQMSLLTLKNMEKNPSLNPDQFIFVMPKGADVFRQ